MSANTRVYQLLLNASATGTAQSVSGGRYIWTVNAGTWNGATATLQVTGADGSTQMTVASAGADNNTAIEAGEGATLRVAITGATPTGVNSTLRQVQ